jgi:RNA polymerase sigma-70 factor (ECF subfamily)
MNLPVRERTKAATSVNAAVDLDDVVRRAQSGDVDAFEIIYRTHTAPIFALCRRMVQDEREALDLVQDIFVRAWERLTTFRGQSTLATWLHRLGVNVVLEHLRASRRDANRLITGDEESYGAHAIGITVETRLDLNAALVRLPTGARTVFVLHDLEGYSHDEISQMTGIAPGTARAQLFRARRALMKLLDR